MNRALRACAAAVVALSIPLMARAAPPPPAPAKPHNIIFVLVDDLRFDGMGFLRPGLKTPNIDFLAKNGVHILETIDTNQLAADGVREFLFVLGIPRIVGTVQMVINPVAIR